VRASGLRHLPDNLERGQRPPYGAAIIIEAAPPPRTRATSDCALYGLERAGQRGANSTTGLNAH
jgi:hypothetical protein